MATVFTPENLPYEKNHTCTLLLLLHPFNGFFPQKTWVSWHQKGKPFWILLEQEMMAQQWHQLDHMQVIGTSLQTDKHASTSPLKLLQAGCTSCCQTNSVEVLKADITHIHRYS